MKERIEKLVELFAAKIADYFENTYPTLDVPIVEVSYGKRYARIIRDRSAAGFVDLESGDIMRPAGWKGPAKNGRGRLGNVMDPDFGISNFSEIGVNYLR